MKDDELTKLFFQVDQAPVDENAKKRAVNLAMAEFAQEKVYEEKNQNIFQGFLQKCRLTFSSQTENRRDEMNFAKKKMVLGGFAGVAVSAVAFMVVNYLPEPMSVDEKLEPEVVSESDVVIVQSPNRVVGPDPAKEMIEEELIITGTREKTQKSANEKRDDQVIADSITAEDIGRTTDQNIADELYRITGVDVAPRDGEGTSINVRGAVQGLSTMNGVSLSSDMEPRAFAMPESKAKKMSLKSVASDVIVPPGYQDEGHDQFQHIEENSVKLVSEEPVSTFSIDVDTASYSFVRSSLNRGVLPQKDAVRIEEMVNYFDYQYPLPKSKSEPFKANVVVTDSPWADGKKLVHIGIKGYNIPQEQSRKTNLVFLLDVSGSMNSPDKLPLVKQSMSLLLSRLGPEDTVAIAVYAGAAGKVLEPTKVKEKQKILDAMNRLQAGGSTAGGQGIKLAYQLAEANFDKNAVNRIILATDGDFNVGIVNREELKGFVERKRDKGIYLSVLGFGHGNYNDHMMQALAQNGNGVAAYIDTLSEAQKVLVNEASSTLFPIAKDVKIQLEFNPATVSEYRLIGYETRKLNREDFNNDKVDAGDIGAGHTVTAIYEITPVASSAKMVDESRYATKPKRDSGKAHEYGFLKVRYKLPEESVSKLITQAIPKENTALASGDILLRETKFATAVAGFSQLLKGSKFIGSWNYDSALNLAQANKGADEYGYRTEFVQLVRKAKIASAM